MDFRTDSSMIICNKDSWVRNMDLEPTFFWQAPLDRDGYEWISLAETETGWHLEQLEGLSADDLLHLHWRRGARLRTYAPMEEEPALFRIFADLEFSQESI